MKLQIPTEKNSLGTTLVELVAVVGIVAVLILAVLIIVNPAEILARGRDEKRFSDMSLLDRAINEYKMDVASYPDVGNTTRISTSLPSGNSGPLVDSTDGWIDVNLSQYATKLPIDPINDENFYYSYRHTQFSYEINAILEHYTEEMVNDGGDDNGVYELGNDLTIL